MALIEFEVKNYNKGIVDSIEDYSIPENAASKSLNWLTKGDKVEITGGYTILGTEDTAAGRISGLHVGTKVNGDKIVIKTTGQKMYFLDGVTWTEMGSNVLGIAADGEDISFTEYVSLAGYQIWASSPNSGLYKIMMANPASIKDLFDAAENFKGYISASNGRLNLWYRENNKNYLYGSYKDVQNSVVYTTVTGEAVGAAPGPNYVGTLATITGLRTGFNVVFTDGTTTVQDNKNGGFLSGATGTINYATGAYNITFDNPTVGPVTVSYQREDSTEKGLADFTFTSPGRLATEGFFLPQATGGDLLNVLNYKETFYCLHELNSWLFVMPTDDLNPTNKEYRNKVGMPNWRGAVATGKGIYYIDTSDPQEPRFNLLTLDQFNAEVEPVIISYAIELKGFDFSQSVATEWGEYILFSCKDSDLNNRVWAFSKKWESFDLLGYFVSCFGNNNGILLGGDSGTNNIQQLFTSFSANGSVVDNYWEGKLSKLDTEELKKCKRLTLQGEIQPSQNLDVYLAFDRAGYTKIGSVSGTGDYVDLGSAVTVGSPTVGVKEVGGGTKDSDGIVAYNYRREFRIRTQRFEEVKMKIVATDVGYVSLSNQNWYDVKKYGKKNLLRYRQVLTT